MSVGAAEAMDVDIPTARTPEQLQNALLSNCTHPKNVKEALGKLTIKNSAMLSDELQFLQVLTPMSDQVSACGITLYSLENYPATKVLGLKKRASKLYFERDFYADLYTELIKIWKDDGQTTRTKIILSGNAGVGKSWYQVCVLRRLLSETPEDRLFRFVVRQVGKYFYLLDLETCSGFTLSGQESDIEQLLTEHGNIRYLYEPAREVDQPPLFVEAPSLSTLSPRKNRIKEYLKEGPHELYMPVGQYNELEYVAEAEKLDLDALEKNFDIFGGIFRYSLFQTEEERTAKTKTVKARCENVSADMLRSIAADIDDDPNSTSKGNISGYILSYTDILRVGTQAFRSPSLTLTSHYVRQRVMDKMSLTSYHEHLKMLAEVLKDKSTDPTGKDLEESVVHMLSAGPATVGWQYQGVQGEPDTSIMSLGHTKRKVTRDTFNPALVNYPSDISYPLADCVLVINGEYWAFQTTWQYDHAFKLRTLRSFRDGLKLPIGKTLNILFVNPKHTGTYVRRRRDKYLAKGEDISKPILDSKKKVLMRAQDVATMWNNTRIFVAFPKDQDWHQAISSALIV